MFCNDLLLHYGTQALKLSTLQRGYVTIITPQSTLFISNECLRCFCRPSEASLMFELIIKKVILISIKSFYLHIFISIAVRIIYKTTDKSLHSFLSDYSIYAEQMILVHLFLILKASSHTTMNFSACANMNSSSVVI